MEGSSTLSVGRYVKIHGLVGAKQHNGKTAIVKAALNEESGRCGVRPVNDEGTKLLAIKPANLTILCSFCKMREEKVVCDRCHKESYCTASCKEKHWDGVNKQSGVPNCHKAWCIPIKFEMEVPKQAVNESNVGEEAFEKVLQYMQLAVDVGNSGRKSEEREMLRKLTAVDKLQPSAWSNLFVCNKELAVMAERYYPEKYEDLAIEAIDALATTIDLVVSDEVNGKRVDPNGPIYQMETSLVKVVKVVAFDFLDARMKGKRGKNNKELQRIALCLMGSQILFTRRDEPLHKLNVLLGVCYQKLMQYEDAVKQFEQCCDPNIDTFCYHAALGQIPQCLLSMALYEENESAVNRLEKLNEAIVKNQEAIEVFKRDENKPNGLPAYRTQVALARSYYNKNSLMKMFAQRGDITYSHEQREECQTLMNDVINDAYRGAVAAGDEASMNELQGIKHMQFP